MILAFSLCLWDHTWKIASCFGLLAQDREGHAEVNPMQGHQGGQGTGAQNTRRGWENCTCSPLGRQGLWGILLRCIIRKASYDIKFLLNMRKKVFTIGMARHWNRHLQMLWSLQPWRSPNPAWARPWATCSNGICLIQEVRLEAFGGPFQPPWVCDSSSMALYPLKSMPN